MYWPDLVSITFAITAIVLYKCWWTAATFVVTTFLIMWSSFIVSLHYRLSQSVLTILSLTICVSVTLRGASTKNSRPFTNIKHPTKPDVHNTFDCPCCFMFTIVHSVVWKNVLLVHCFRKFLHDFRSGLSLFYLQ